jgi:hypothetical protein
MECEVNPSFVVKNPRVTSDIHYNTNHLKMGVMSASETSCVSNIPVPESIDSAGIVLL